MSNNFAERRSRITPFSQLQSNNLRQMVKMELLLMNQVVGGNQMVDGVGGNENQVYTK
ncbi:hypothetical protein [Neomicrococcus aestuarii]|uniref:Uncharacterized protein n=1 Tax=Neomicrococcus aestuarii TaxID=556325 RepID=A0A7W8TVE4_9MICC|nr:hypothetical protein [Neomicrococcus aestuarii]MBB5512728.1 hypothetical protein [Neomicrococcus aestuarii]